jgi:hypothetical protein
MRYSGTVCQGKNALIVEYNQRMVIDGDLERIYVTGDLG